MVSSSCSKAAPHNGIRVTLDAGSLAVMIEVIERALWLATPLQLLAIPYVYWKAARNIIDKRSTHHGQA